MTAGSEVAARSLRTDRNFAVFWFVQALSEVGNAFALVAVPLLVLEATGSVARMGLLTATAGAASVVTGLFAGTLVDRFDRRRLMVLCEVARAVLYGLIPVCWAADPQMWLLYAVMGAAAVLEMIFQVAYVAAIPNLVDKERISAANGLLQTTNSAAYVLGPMLAGLVAGVFGVTAALSINAASFAVSAVGLALIRFRPREERAVAARWFDLREGFLAGAGFLWRTPVLRALTLLLTVFLFLSLGMTDVFIYHVRHDLGQNDRVVGYVMGAAGVGTIAGAALMSPLRRWWGFGPCWLGSVGLCGVVVAVAGVAGNVVVAGGMVLAYSLGVALAGLCSMSLRQEVTPDHLLGRVTSAFWTMHNVLAPIGAVVLTALAKGVGVKDTLLAAGAAFLCVAGVGLFTPVRLRRPAIAADAAAPPGRGRRPSGASGSSTTG
ncbi:MFS transporter [Actinoallomurus iriomotensis]|uniref:MFS transporter n=1 Tax=Actinoallomurus iriomotensis TaxID=478107 RepID=A0A9W6RBX1_9ACTN|nr:MFS transporter [Actinoallomurus iriomotensis]GLY72978.1 MFS transporter [Actinoallomurus iriomotensis]